MVDLIEIKNTLRELGLRPSKAKGQNFLIDKNVLQKIVAAADLKKQDCVLEVGPGLGVLTEELVKVCRKVLAVELDKAALFYLRKKFQGLKNLEILGEDILKIHNEDIARQINPAQGSYKLVANLPYAITKPLLRKFLSYQPKPIELVVLVQKEVAEKICYKKDQANILGLTVGFYGRPQIIAYVPAESFYPQPKVASAILKVEVRTEIPQEVTAIFKEKGLILDEKVFWRLVKIGFSSPRKQLHNNLGAGFKLSSDQVKNILKICHLEEASRAQNLTLTDWAKLYTFLIV